MVMLQGWWKRTVRRRRARARSGSASLVGNVVGSMALAAGVCTPAARSPAPAPTLVGDDHAAKDAATGPQLFWRAVLCNALVCLALWMAARTRSDAAKLVVLWWALLAFIGSGFEHSIANVTTFSLARPRGVDRLGRPGPQPAVDGARQRRRRWPRDRPRLRLDGRRRPAVSRARDRQRTEVTIPHPPLDARHA